MDIIVRQQGKGTFVARARKHKLVEFSDVEIFETKDDKVTVLSIERGNDLKYLEKLGPTCESIHIIRIELCS